MYPHERSLVKNLAGLPFVLLGVNSADPVSRVQELVADGTVTWRSFKDEQGENGPISQEWQVDGFPTVYIIDSEGIIRSVNPQRTAKRHDAIDEAIAALLAEMGHEFPEDSDPGEQGGLIP